MRRVCDFARHHGFTIAPCNVGRGNEKGRVESGVGYVKKNFLHGIELTDFSTIQAAAQVWLDTIANVRIHGETQQRPVDLFAQERPHLGPLNPHPYDLAHTSTSVASSQFRITLDTNQYSVPATYAHRRVTVKAYPDRVCIYFDNQLIARHPRRYGRRQDIEDPDHAKGLIAQRSRAREQRLMMRFLALSPDATAYYDGLEQRRLNARHHVRKILALAEIYPVDAVARAISDGLAFQAFSAEYITNILEARARALPEPAPLQLTRRHDLLDIDIAPPDLNAYEVNEDAIGYATAAVAPAPHEGETTLRENRSIERRIRNARFPVLKTLEEFQWSWPKKINRPQIQNLFRLAFIATQTNVVLIGNVGLGKTHLSIALGHAACLNGHTVLFTTAVDIINTLAAAQSAGRLKRELHRYLKPAVLIVDELGYVPIDKHGADLLFQIISQRYERAPMVITSNRAYKHWSQIFNNDSTLTSAILDRVLHHAETVIIEGTSFRMKDEIDA